MFVTKGRVWRPRRILLYGQHGVGKSTFAAGAPQPVFLDCEDGLNDLDVAKTPLLKSYGDVLSAISYLGQSLDKFQTVVVDTADWLQSLLFAQIAHDASKKSIEEIAYGRGYKMAETKWHELLNHLDHLRANGKHVVFLAHAKIARFESPETNSYDRYEPDLHAVGSSVLQEWCDEVLFASFRVFTRTEDQGFNRERAIAVGGKERFIRTSESAAALAKNRLGLPDELPMTWAALAQFIPPKPATQQLAQPAGNIAGIVNDGSSKKTVEQLNEEELAAGKHAVLTESGELVRY